MDLRRSIWLAAAAALGVSATACGGSTPSHAEPATTATTSGSTGASQASCGAGEGSGSCGAAHDMADGGMPMSH